MAEVSHSASGPPRKRIGIPLLFRKEHLSTFIDYDIFKFFQFAYWLSLVCLHVPAASRWTGTHKSNGTRKGSDGTRKKNNCTRIWSVRGKQKLNSGNFTTVAWRRRSRCEAKQSIHSLLVVKRVWCGCTASVVFMSAFQRKYDSKSAILLMLRTSSGGKVAMRNSCRERARMPKAMEATEVVLILQRSLLKIKSFEPN